MHGKVGKKLMSKKVIDNIYEKEVSFSHVLEMWKIVKRTCKNKKEVYKFMLNCNTNIYNITYFLKYKKYVPGKYRLFMIHEPKPRLVMSQNVYDKIVNHFVANYFLIPYLERKLLDCNVATRKDKGASYASTLLIKYINEIRMKYPKCDIYALKLDISKYFYNIDHNILIDMLEKDIKDNDVINIIKIILDETNKSYINEEVIRLNDYNNTNIPLYKKDVGLSIGAMTSQFFAALRN